MSGRDHETDHDGECFPECRECELEQLRKLVKKLTRDLKEADAFHLTTEQWERKWGKDG